MGLIYDFLSGENRRREEAAKRAVGIDEDYEQRFFLATHPDASSEDETDEEYEEENDEDYEDEIDEEDEEDTDDEEKMSDTEIICGAIIGAKILRRGEELGLVNLDDL